MERETSIDERTVEVNMSNVEKTKKRMLREEMSERRVSEQIGGSPFVIYEK